MWPPPSVAQVSSLVVDVVEEEDIEVIYGDMDNDMKDEVGRLGPCIC